MKDWNNVMVFLSWNVINVNPSKTNRVWQINKCKILVEQAHCTSQQLYNCDNGNIYVCSTSLLGLYTMENIVNTKNINNYKINFTIIISNNCYNQHHKNKL